MDMKKSVILFAILWEVVLFSGSVSGENHSGVKLDQLKKYGIRYLDLVFDSVQVSKDVFFGEVTNYRGKVEKLTLDVYTPFNDSEKKRPAIMWIHGGGFRPGNDKTQKYIVQMSKEFAKRGYVCFSIDYRVRETPKDDILGTVSDAVSDAMLALNWIRENSKKFGIDKNKLVIGGGSAGGMTAVNFCCKDAEGSEKWDKKGIVAMVDLWGSPPVTHRFYRIDPTDPPAVIVHGTADALVAYSNSVELVKELEANKIPHELVTIEGAGHTPSAHMKEFVVSISKFLYKFL